jgi:beta-glucanase (GH16 family)
MKNVLNIKYSIPVALVFFLLFSVTACDTDATQTVDSHNWELTWYDEFDGTAGDLPDATKWTYDTGNGGWGNDELQYYTNSTDNVALDGDGNLVITAISESYEGSSYTSARIKTKGLFSQTYGRFEASIKTPYGPGLWPAFWMMGSNIDDNAWPACGEIDIMEQNGLYPNVNNGSLHATDFDATDSYTLENDRFDNDFHIYAIEWFADKIDFYVDDYLYESVSRSTLEGSGVAGTFDLPFFMILNVAVGGDYVGWPTTGTSFPQTMTIDYVRVYQEVE